MGFRAAAVALAVATLLIGCSDDEPLTEPLAASEAPSESASPSPTPSPTPSPSPSPTPLSPFEADPAVQALRTYLAASAQAINAEDLTLPALAAVATEKRQARFSDLYAEDLGTHFPGPPPTAVLGVQVVSPTSRVISTCLLDDGFALDRPGGTPTEPRLVVPGFFEMVLEGGTWKVDRAVRDPDRSCDGVPLPGEAA